MSDSRSSDNQPIDDFDAFQEWVSHTAETRDVDRQELLNQLVSAFWVLDEMADVASETPLPDSQLAADRPSHRQSRETDQLGTDTRSVDHDASSPTDTAASDDTAPSSSSTDRTGARPPTNAEDTDREPAAADRTRNTADSGSNTADMGSNTADADSNPDDLDPTTQEIRSLRESIHTQLETVQAIGTLRRQVNDLSLDVEKQRSEQEQFTDRISDDLTRIYNRLETLESDDDGEIDQDAIESIKTDLTAEIERVESDLSAEIMQVESDLSAAVDRVDEDHDALESWVDEEFDQIEGLFTRVLDTTRSVEDRVDELAEKVNRIESAPDNDDNNGLQALRREAASAGVSAGSCAACDSTVDLSLLDEPACPHCGTGFESIDTNTGWNPFSKPTIRTVDESTVPEAFTE